MKAASKPNFVPRGSYPPSGPRSFIWDVRCRTPLATYPEARTGSPQTLPYLVLHWTGFTKLLRSPGELVRSYRTVSPLPCCFNKETTRRSTLCCTFLHVAATPRYGASCPAVFGLSSRSIKIQRSYSLLPPYMFTFFSASSPVRARS